MNIKEIKELAKAKCAPNKGRLALIFFIYSAIIGALSITIKIDEDTSYSISILNMILGGALMYGVINVISLNYHGTCPEVERLFDGFKYFGKLMKLYILVSLYTALWTLLFIIPGIIKSYSYSMAFYIFFDNPELSASECITRSKQMTSGFKGDLFKLDLSYLGWILLSILTLGILLFWVSPKMYTAKYECYLQMSGKKNRIVEEKVLAENEFETSFE